MNSDIPHETIAALRALGLPAETIMKVIEIIGDMLSARSSPRGISLSDDWAPDDSDITYGLAHGLTEDQVMAIAEEMRMWAYANKNRPVARKAGAKGWGLTFKAWLLREAKKGKANSKGSRTSMLDVACELGAKANGHSPYNGSGTRVAQPLLTGLDLGTTHPFNTRSRR
jgi:hypothetical protein